MTRVLHILDHSVPLTDGYCVRSKSIVRWQRELGLDPVVVTSTRQTDRYGDTFREACETINGTRYYRSESRSEIRLPFVPEMQRLRRMYKRMHEVAMQEQPDLIHAHSPCLWGLAANRVARKRKIPFVYEIRGFWEDALVDSGKTTTTSTKYKLIRHLETRVCRSADLVTTIAEGLRDDIVQRGVNGRKVHMVPNGVSVDDFTPSPVCSELVSELKLEDRIVVGYIGSLYSWEGVEDLVRAARSIAERVPNAAVVIVGGGEKREAIETLVTELGVGNIVKLVGRVPHEQVESYYSIVDVLVYPRIATRNTELCTPLKPLEAMAMGKAIVGSSVGGIKELVPEGTGLIHRAGDATDLADKCVDLLVDARKRKSLGEQARRHVIEHRNWRNVAATYEQLYQRLRLHSDGQPKVVNPVLSNVEAQRC